MEDHFGSASIFMIYETEHGGYEFVCQEKFPHLHGSCQPLDFFQKSSVDAVICCNIGARALEKLNHINIKIFWNIHNIWDLICSW